MKKFFLLCKTVFIFSNVHAQQGVAINYEGTNFRVMNLQQQRVDGLKSGVYILKVEGWRSFKVIVQTDGNPLTNLPVINLSPIKN